MKQKSLFILILSIQLLLLISLKRDVKSEFLKIQNDTFSPLNKNEQHELDEGVKKLSEFLHFVKKTQTEPSFKKDKFTDGIICEVCHTVQNYIHNFLLQKYGLKYFFNALVLVCRLFLRSDVCNGLLNDYGPIIYDGIVDHYLDAEFICTTIRVCNNHFIRLNADDYARKVLKDKPVNITKPVINKNATTWKVLHVSDIHTDAGYMEVRL